MHLFARFETEKALCDKVERPIRGGVSERISSQINPHRKSRQHGLLQNGQRLAEMVSSLVSTESWGLETTEPVRAAEVRTENAGYHRHGYHGFAGSHEAGIHTGSLENAGCHGNGAILADRR